MKTKRIFSLIIIVSMIMSTLLTGYAIENSSGNAENIVKENEVNLVSDKSETEEVKNDKMDNKAETIIPKETSVPNEQTVPSVPIEKAPEDALKSEDKKEDKKEEVTNVEAGVPAKSTGDMTQEEYFQSTIDKYSKFDWSDPQVIKDDAFFGVWDGSAWTKKPYLEYEKYPGLEPVSEAAKTGDYETAKEEVLEYYRGVFATHNRGIIPENNARKILTAQMPFENVIMLAGSGEAVAKWNLKESEGDFTADVLQDVNQAVKSVSKVKAYEVTALNKDGYMGVFNSSEDKAKSPYVEATIDGTVKYFYPEDSTIMPIENRNKNFGQEPLLKVEESYTARNATKEIDKYSKRIYMLFDFSGIEKGQTLTNATLHMNGMMMESDNPVKTTEKKKDKDVVLWSIKETNWNEDNVTWGNRTHDIFSYDGKKAPTFADMRPETPTIPSWQDNTGKWSYVPQMGKVYLYTNEEAYAYHGIRMLLNTIMLNGSRVNNSTISGLHNVGQRAKWYPTVIDCFITSKYMTPEAFTTILKDVYGVCQSLVTDWYSASENNNHGSLQTEGLFALATSFKEFDKFDDPTTGLKNPAQPGSMQGGWLGVAKHRLSYKAAKDLADDGSSIEVGLGYSDLNLGTFTQTIKNATMVGLDPREVFNDEDLKFLEKYALYLMNVSTPTFGDWQQGHGYTHASTYNTKWKPLNDITQNPYLLWATSGGTDPNGREPEYKSIVYPEGRKVLLRSGWNKNAVAMQTNADGGQKSHGQHDDLGLNFYAYGQHFLVDGLYHNYDVSHPYNVFLNSTRAHNTIEINGASQKGEGFTASTGRKDPYGNIINSPTGGKAGDVHSENQELNDEYDFVRVETVNYTGNNYDGEGDFKEYRDILFIHPEYAIVTDYINPTNDKENTYTQNWHFIPKSGYTIDNATNTITTNMDGANLILAPVNQKDDFVASQREGCYAVSAGAEIDNPYMAFEKKVKGATTFNTVLYPTKPGEDRTVVTKNIELDVSEAEASAFSLEITNPLDNSTKVGTYYNLHDTTKKGTRTIGNYSTDANIIYVEKSGDNITSMIIRQGTFIYDNSLKKYLVKSEEEISDLKIDLEGSKINMTTSKVDGAKKVNCDKISILNKFITKDVVLNKKNIKFAQKGNCVYMGTTPGFEDSDNPVKPEDKPNNDGGGSGSGAGGSGSHSSVPDNTGTTGPVPVPTQEPGDNGLNSEMKKELENHWAKEEITKMVTDKVVNGISETSLGLTETTTRAEFITMIVRALKLEIVKYSGEFSDVVSGDWYADYLATAAKAGFIHGNEGMADPNGYLTREEMAKILVNAYENKNGTITEKKSDFSDYQDISEWARPFVNKATTVKLLNGMEDGTFLPKEKALREQAIVVIYRLIYK